MIWAPQTQVYGIGVATEVFKKQLSQNRSKSARLDVVST